MIFPYKTDIYCSFTGKNWILFLFHELIMISQSGLSLLLSSFCRRFYVFFSLVFFLPVLLYYFLIWRTEDLVARLLYVYICLQLLLDIFRFSEDFSTYFWNRFCRSRRLYQYKHIQTRSWQWHWTRCTRTFIRTQTKSEIWQLPSRSLRLNTMVF